MANFISDAEMAKIESQDVAQSAGKSPKFISDEEMQALEGQGHGLGNTLLNLAIEGGKFIDSYTGAPARSAIGALQDGKNPISAFGNQFGENPDLAPTGKQIAQKAGVPDTSLSDVIPSLYTDNPQEAEQFLKFQRGGPADISASGAAGLGIDIAADPTLIIPAGQVAKLAGNSAKLGAKAAVNATVKGAELAQKAASAGEKAILGTKAIDKTSNFVKGTAQVIKEGSKNTAEAISKLVNPKIAEDFDELTKIAEKNGIDPSLLPDSVKWGENSFFSRAQRHKAEGTLGEPVLKKYYQGLEAVQNAAENKIASIGGGKVPDAVEAGDIIRSGFDKGVDSFFKDIGMTHNKVIEAIPKLKIEPESFAKIESKLDGIEKWAKGRAQRGFTATQRSQADQVLKAIEAVRGSKVSESTLKNVTVNGKKLSTWVREDLYSYKRLVETLRDIGEVAFKSKNVLADIPPDIEKFRDLYFTLDDALISTAEKAGGKEVANSLRESNKAISEFLGDKSIISSTIGSKNISPENVFKSLVLNGDTKKIQSLAKILPPEEFKGIKSAFLKSLIKENVDGGFSFKALHNNLRDKRSLVGALFSPQEIDEISDIVKLGSRIGDPILSYSGTGASNVFSDIAKGARNALENDTIIDLMKRRAENKALSGAKDVTGLVAKTSGKAPPQKALIQNKNFKRAIGTSPIAARIASTQSDKDGQSSQSSTQLKGEAKWAKDGYLKLIEHDKSGLFNDGKIAENLFSTNEGVNLLIQASDLKPGSKAMEKVVSKIKNKIAVNERHK